jgi:hypothetical protein
VLTENKEPDRESSTENSLPEEPSMDSIVEPEPTIVVEPDTLREFDAVTDDCTFSIEFIINPDVFVASKVVVADVDSILNLLVFNACSSKATVALPAALNIDGVEETLDVTVKGVDPVTVTDTSPVNAEIPVREEVPVTTSPLNIFACPFFNLIVCCYY